MYNHPPEGGKTHNKMKIETLSILGKVKLGELEAGKLFMHNGVIALKSEYRTEKGAVEAYIVGSGEMFWGGASTAKEQVEIEVIELGFAGL